MKRVWLTVAAGLLALALTPVGAPAQGNSKGKGQGQGQTQGRGAKAVAPQFREADRGVLADYYAKGRGRGRSGSLPPGLAKQLQRNGTLPPGLDKQIVAFPREIELRLPPCPPEVRRGIIGNVAVMWNSRTGLIVDVLALAGF